MITSTVGNTPSSSAPVTQAIQERANDVEPNPTSTADRPTNDAVTNIFIFSGLCGVALTGIGPALAVGYNVITGSVLSGMAAVCCVVACCTEDAADIRLDPNNPFPISD